MEGHAGGNDGKSHQYAFREIAAGRIRYGRGHLGKFRDLDVNGIGVGVGLPLMGKPVSSGGFWGTVGTRNGDQGLGTRVFFHDQHRGSRFLGFVIQAQPILAARLIGQAALVDASLEIFAGPLRIPLALSAVSDAPMTRLRQGIGKMMPLTVIHGLGCGEGLPGPDEGGIAGMRMVNPAFRRPLSVIQTTRSKLKFPVLLP